MNTMQNELKVGKLEFQMEAINKSFENLNKNIEKKFDALDQKFIEVFNRFDAMEARYEARYVRKESFLFYQIVLGAIGMAVLSYGISIALPNIFRQ